MSQSNFNRSPRVQPDFGEGDLISELDDNQVIDNQPLVLLGTEKYVKHENPNESFARVFLFVLGFFGKFLGWTEDDISVSISCIICPALLL